MKEPLRKLKHFFKGEVGTGLGIIIIAAVLVELISIVQYNRIRKVVDHDLDVRSKIVLGAVADNIGHTLELTEVTMRENLWEIRHSLSNPDSVFNAVEHLIDDNPHVLGGCLAFVPYYYPRIGRLYEPYVSKKNGGFNKEQLASVDHDYTLNPTFQQVLRSKTPTWSDPYFYGTDSLMSLTTYSYPIFDIKGKIAAVCGLDLDLTWLGDTLNFRQPYQSSFSLMLTREGALVAGPSQSKVPKEQVEQVVNIINGKQALPRGSDITIRQGSLKRAPYWMIVQVFNNSEVFAPMRKIRLQQMLLILAGLLILFFMIERYARNESKLRTVHSEQARINGELAVAKKIQMEMLPKTFPPFPERKDLDIFGNLVPAREVGGDLFDFFIRDEKLFFCIGDVSGKGVPSAMVMSVIHSLFRMISETEDSPGRIISALNGQLCRDNDTNMFVTFFLGVLDLESGIVRFCNAGHDKPLLVKESVDELEAMPNLPLGVFEDTAFQEQSLSLSSGTTIFLYTDGLTEAKDTQRQQFTKARVKDALLHCIALPEMNSEKMTTSVGQEVHAFTQGAEQSDDLTMLAIHYIRKEHITLTNDIKEIERLGEFVKSLTEHLGIEHKTAYKLRLALEEIVTNVISYAYPEGQRGSLDIEAGSDGKDLMFTVSDSGKEFDPTAIAPADISLDAEERPLGGLGIFLARNIMDEISYKRSDNKNVLTLKKSLI